MNRAQRPIFSGHPHPPDAPALWRVATGNPCAVRLMPRPAIRDAQREQAFPGTPPDSVSLCVDLSSPFDECIKSELLQLQIKRTFGYTQ